MTRPTVEEMKETILYDLERANRAEAALREIAEVVAIGPANDASSRNAFDVHAAIAFRRIREILRSAEKQSAQEGK